MRQGDLRAGGRYILKGRSNQVAVYEGIHNGVLKLADGGTFSGAERTLKFRFTDPSGVERVALFENAGAIEEPEETMLARMAENARIKERQEAATDEAEAFLTGLGLNVLRERGKVWWDMSEDERANTVVLARVEESADDIDVDEVTVGKIKRMLRSEALV